MQKIQTAIATVTQLVPDAAAAINGREIAKEVFGAAGFDNGARFFDFDKVDEMKANPQADPQMQLAQQQMEAKAQVEQGKMEIAQGKLQLENSKLQLEQQESMARLKELEAQIALIIAKTATENVTAVYEATQAAGVIAQNPGIALASDEILKSSGFMDHNPPPVAQEIQQPVDFVPPENESTQPGFPPQPQSAATGIMRGIRTPEIES
jgi:uncharacterized glyoxalase superfamily protein PhnB